MKITLLRHYKVKHTWKSHCTSDEFKEECKQYDKKPIHFPPERNATQSTIYTSTLPRAIETAKHYFSTSEIIQTELLNEVEMHPYKKTHRKKPIMFWLFRARLLWQFQKREGIETRDHTLMRINRLLDIIEAKGDDCILVGHGFYFFVMSSVLEHRGYQRDGHRRLKNGKSATYCTVHC